MRARYRRNGNTHELYLYFDDKKDPCDLKEFARVGDTFTGEIRKDPSYKHPHIILRRETT